MPELPEVDAFKTYLSTVLIGKTIVNIEVLNPKIIKKPNDITLFINALCQQTVQEVNRKGKHLIFSFDEFVLVSHLRMTGQFSIHQKSDKPSPYTRIIFQFTDELELRYIDMRNIGTMHLYQHSEPIATFDTLGFDPINDAFTTEKLANLFKNTQRPIKSVLLDQTVLVGIGNIYGDEILYQAKINPNRSASSLNRTEISRLKKCIIQTLQEAIAHGGAYQFMEKYSYEPFRIYGKKEKPCEDCGTFIERCVIGGRGSYYCPNCQQ